ncbi:MAG: MerR family transcriptional regulator [Terrisporobacter sp.]|uniref:MerR family transcriptional regulator n=1 Tax=Terrisporobacter sp. TaxID=1965305 RepID=UPI002FCA5060
MKDFYKIGEISEMYDMSRDSLMYYEKLEILNPIRDDNGYRLYSISDIWRLNLIKELKSLGFSFKMIKEYLDKRDINSTNKLLINGIELLDEQIYTLLKQKENMRKRMYTIADTYENSNLNNIELNYLKKRKGTVLNGQIKRDEEFDLLIQKLQKKYNNKFGILGNNSVGSVFSIESLNKGITTDFESVFCFLNDDAEDYNIEFEEGYYVTLIYAGDYTNNTEHIQHMFDFIEDNKLIIRGNPIEIYKIDIHETEKCEEYITEIQIPIKC